MFDKDPTSYDVITYAWVALLSMWSGAVGYHLRVRRGLVKVVSALELIGDLMSSVLVGTLTFWMCESAGIDKLQAAILISIAAHMGPQTLSLYEKYWEFKMKKLMKMEKEIMEDKKD